MPKLIMPERCNSCGKYGKESMLLYCKLCCKLACEQCIVKPELGICLVCMSHQPKEKPIMPVESKKASKHGRLTFRKFQAINFDRCIAIQDPSEWLSSDWAVAFAGECGEALNIIKKLNRKRDGIKGDKLTRDQLRRELGKELADTVTYAFLIASIEGIDLEDVTIDKFNEISDRLGLPNKIARRKL